MIKQCPNCKKDFLLKKRIQKFCSKTCSGKFTSKTRAKPVFNAGMFKRGSLPWNKGLKGFGKEFGFKKGHGFIGGGSPKGVRVSKMTEFKKGDIPWNKDKRGVMKTPWNKGLGHSTRSERQKEISSADYKKWRRDIFSRDKYSCVKCGKSKCRIEADHIKMWTLYPELRYDINNGQTLCRDCHKEKTRVELSIYWKNQYSGGKAILTQ